MSIRDWLSSVLSQLFDAPTAHPGSPSDTGAAVGAQPARVISFQDKAAKGFNRKAVQ